MFAIRSPILEKALLSEFKAGFYRLPNKSRNQDVMCIIIRIASCIPVIGAASGIGYILLGCRLKKLDPSLSTIANPLISRGILCILGIGILNLVIDNQRKKFETPLLDILIEKGSEHVKKAKKLVDHLKPIDNDFELLQFGQIDLSDKFRITVKGVESRYCTMEKLIEVAKAVTPVIKEHPNRKKIFFRLTYLNNNLLEEFRKNPPILQQAIHNYDRFLTCYPESTLDVNAYFSKALESTEDELKEAFAVAFRLAQADDIQPKNVTPLFYLPFKDLLKTYLKSKPLLECLPTFSERVQLFEWIVENPEIDLRDAPTSLLQYLPLVPDINEIPWEQIKKDPESALKLLFPKEKLCSFVHMNHYRFLLAFSRGTLREELGLEDTSPLVRQAHTNFIKYYFDRIPEEEITSTVKSYYYMVLDSKKLRQSLEGDNINGVAKKVVDYLRLYKAHAIDKQKVSDLADNLENAHSKYSKPNRVKPKSIFLSGTMGHAVCYAIDRTTFTLYNSGQGASTVGNQVISPTYFNLTAKDLSPEFFNTLNEYSLKGVHYKEVASYIDSKLNHGDNVDRSKRHKQQNHGSCSYKCLSHYMHDTLGTKEFRAYKVWLTGHLIHHFSSLPLTSEEHFEMLNEGKEVYYKRLRKLNLLEAP